MIDYSDKIHVHIIRLLLSKQTLKLKLKLYSFLRVFLGIISEIMAIGQLFHVKNV